MVGDGSQKLYIKVFFWMNSQLLFRFHHQFRHQHCWSKLLHLFHHLNQIYKNIRSSSISENILQILFPMKFMEEVENMQSQAGKRKILLILKKFHFHQKNGSQYLVTSFSQRITGWPGVIFSGAPTVFWCILLRFS